VRFPQVLKDREQNIEKKPAERISTFVFIEMAIIDSIAPLLACCSMRKSHLVVNDQLKWRGR
jgi:hypothetical protein